MVPPVSDLIDGPRQVPRRLAQGSSGGVAGAESTGRALALGSAGLAPADSWRKGKKEEQIRASGLSGKPGSQTKLITPMLK